MNATTTRRVYAACLSAYNNGRLHGRWIDATQGADHIRDEIAAMLAASPEPGAEEFAFHDSEGLGGLGEFESIDRVAALGEALDNADEPGALLAWLDNDAGNDPADFADYFLGTWDTLADYVQETFSEYTAEAEKNCRRDGWFHPSRYVDWDAMARDLFLNGEVWTANADGGRIYLFSNH
jgi:hypothetical protein